MEGSLLVSSKGDDHFLNLKGDTDTHHYVDEYRIDDKVNNTINEKGPEDKNSLVLVIFIVLGTGVSLPWNAFVNAGDYFNSLYGDIFPAFMFFLPLVVNWSGCICMMSTIKVMPRLSFSVRVYTCFLLSLFALAVIPFLDSLVSPHFTAMVLTFVGISLCGIAGSVLGGALFGLSALFPPAYTGSMMTGYGVAGILASVMRIVSKVAEPNTKAGYKMSGMLFFSMAGGVILVCLGCYAFMMSSPFTKYYILKSKKIEQLDDNDTEYLLSKHSTNTISEKNSGTRKVSQVSTSAVWKKIWLESLLVASVMFVTLSLFPGITLLVRSAGHPPISPDWFGIILLTIYTSGDFLIRLIIKWYVAFTPKTLAYPVMLRFIFFVLFPLCINPDVIHNDYAVYIVMVLFAISNGYLQTLAMMFAPTLVDDHEKEYAGFIMQTSTSVGVLVGVHFAFVMRYCVTGSFGIHV